MMRQHRALLWVVVALLLVGSPSGPLVAQPERPLRWPSADPAAFVLQRDTALGSIPAMAGAGVLGGTLGLLVGGLAGYYITGGAEVCGDDPCGLVAGALGALAGESIGLALGVHLANRSRGSYVRDLQAAVAVAALGVGVMAAIDPDEGGVIALVLTPAVQLAATIFTERRSSRE